MRQSFFRAPFGGRHPASTAALAWGKTSIAVPPGFPARYRSKPCAAATANTSKPTSIHA